MSHVPDSMVLPLAAGGTSQYGCVGNTQISCTQRRWYIL